MRARGSSSLRARLPPRGPASVGQLPSKAPPARARLTARRRGAPARALRLVVLILDTRASAITSRSRAERLSKAACRPKLRGQEPRQRPNGCASAPAAAKRSASAIRGAGRCDRGPRRQRGRRRRRAFALPPAVRSFAQAPAHKNRRAPPALAPHPPAALLLLAAGPRLAAGAPAKAEEDNPLPCGCTDVDPRTSFIEPAKFTCWCES